MLDFSMRGFHQSYITACVGCTNSCQGGCHGSCNTGCNSGCQTSCNGCDGGCQGSCDSGCNSGCQEGCTTGCDSGCTTSCDGHDGCSRFVCEQCTSCDSCAGGAGCRSCQNNESNEKIYDKETDTWITDGSVKPDGGTAGSEGTKLPPLREGQKREGTKKKEDGTYETKFTENDNKGTETYNPSTGEIKTEYTEGPDKGTTITQKIDQDGNPTGPKTIEYPGGDKKVINEDGSGYYQPKGGEPQPFGPGEGGGCM